MHVHVGPIIYRNTIHRAYIDRTCRAGVESREGGEGGAGAAAAGWLSILGQIFNFCNARSPISKTGIICFGDRPTTFNIAARILASA